MSSPGRPRVLLVEDDPAIRRFVEMALEDEALQLQCCPSVPEAREALERAPVALLLTDLTLRPGTPSGWDLLAALADEPALGARVGRAAVFSAGLQPRDQQRLQALGVTAWLEKPVSLARLRAFVREAAGLLDTPRPPPDLPSPDVLAAFGGDVTLWTQFARSSVPLLRADLDRGDAAVRIPDDIALRHLGHSLRTVLDLLGEPEAGARARALQQAAQARDREAMRAAWQALRPDLLRLLAVG